MTRIDIRGLRKEYGTHVAIPGLDVVIDEGEFFTLLGPSGCGKTTLLRMIAGFNSIEGGTISFDGTVINDRPPAARNIGMVFQNYALFPQMTAAKNVAFGLQSRSVSRSDQAARVAAALDDVQMAHLADRMPGAMSGGQQQRVALARALVIRPAVLLMDEPLSNLDAKLRVEMRDAIRAAQREAGITTVYVTHDQEEAMAVSDRIAVMNGGEIQQLGTPEEIYHRPANTFVAEFIGKTNFLRRRVDTVGGVAGVEMGDGLRVPVPALPADAASAPDVVVSARPEAVHSVAVGGLPAVVEDETFLGSHTHVRATLASGESVDFVEFGRIARFRRGQDVRLGFDAARLNVFDGASGKSLLGVSA